MNIFRLVSLLCLIVALFQGLVFLVFKSDDICRFGCDLAVGGNCGIAATVLWFVTAPLSCLAGKNEELIEEEEAEKKRLKKEKKQRKKEAKEAEEAAKAKEEVEEGEAADKEPPVKAEDQAEIEIDHERDYSKNMLDEEA